MNIAEDQRAFHPTAKQDQRAFLTTLKEENEHTTVIERWTKAKKNEQEQDLLMNKNNISWWTTYEKEQE